MDSLEFIDLLIKLFIAHFLADFALQPHSWVKEKDAKKIGSKYLYMHVVIHGVLSYILIAQWTNFWLPITIIAVHFLIDILKVYQKKNFKWFAIDQALHIISLIVIWMLFYHQQQNMIAFLTVLFGLKSFWALTLGYVLILSPVSILIYQATKKWHDDINEDQGDSLNAVGKWVGILERILIFTFILLNQFAAIGFLLAAKSIFRFGDLTEKKDRKLTEYIVIGTFLSFTVTIIIGLIIKYMFL